MDIKKLQEKLVEKILLLPTEADSEASGREALGIINELMRSLLLIINSLQF